MALDPFATLFPDEAIGDEEKLSYGRGVARETWAWFTHELLILVPRAAPGLGTFGVTEHGILLWDPACVKLWSVQEIAAALLHECCHRVQRHMSRARAAHIHPRIANIAGDLAINTMLRAAGITLPTRFPNAPPGQSGALFPEMYGFPDGLLMEEYAELLKQQLPPTALDGGEGDGGSADGDKDKKPADGKGKGPNPPGTPMVGAGWCGSCAGHPVPNEPEATDPEARSEADTERAHRATAEAMVQAEGKRAGSVPGALLKWANLQLTPPKIDWRKRLARYLRSAIAFRAGAVDYTWRRPSRHQAGVGYGAGRPVLPGLHAPQPRAAILFDRSYSMGDHEVQQGASEAVGILRATGAAVDLISFDVGVNTMRKVKDVRELLNGLVGGGGTSFVAAFAALERLNPRPEVAVVVTDGFDDGQLTAPPRGISIIWLLVGRSVRVPYSWGHAVHIDDIAPAVSDDDAA